ncbi:MAG: deoxyhypusine synthase [Nitrospinae bacterium]|nr:deoxyhypusine synthase [Nitrospinota bacterium]
MKDLLGKQIIPEGIEDGSTVDRLIDKMGNTAFQGRKLALARDIWVKMLEDDVTIFFGLAGAMVPAGMRKIISSLIEKRMIDCLVSTGANLFHDCHETLGRFHYQGSEIVDDIELFKKGIDRIYDVFASEEEFRKTDDFIMNWAITIKDRSPITTREFFYLLGRELSIIGKTEGILTSAYKGNVPIYCPAIGDSSIGIAMATGVKRGRYNFTFDILKDLIEIADIAEKVKDTGVIYIGGGTPKNFIQQTEIMVSFLNNSPPRGHKYAIQITTDLPHWGGLSGCTFKEAQSWGKISKSATSVSLHSDATIALPIIATATIDKAKDILKKREPFTFNLEHERG